MYKLAIAAATATVFAFLPMSAQAGGWGGKSSWSSKSHYGGLLNVSPSIDLGNIAALNGLGILNGSPILSGNSILSGNNTGIGVLGTGTGLLHSIVKTQKDGKRGRRHRR